VAQLCRFFAPVPTKSLPPFRTAAPLPLLALAILVGASLSAFCQSAPPPNYYDSAIGTTGAALKSALHEIIKGHTALPYTAATTDTWDALKVLDENTANSADVLLIYSGYGAVVTTTRTKRVVAVLVENVSRTFKIVALSSSTFVVSALQEEDSKSAAVWGL